MAELIPIEYQLRVSQRERVGLWMAGGALALVLCAGSLIYTYVWRHQQATMHESLANQFQDQASLMLKSQELQNRRTALAGRMMQVQHLMDDKTLLALLRNVCEGFGPMDCLEDVSIEYRPTKGADKSAAGQNPYLVHVTGITSSSSTLAELMTRLGRRSPVLGTRLNVVLETSHREKLLDGQVMRFRILCHEAAEQGS